MHLITVYSASGEPFELPEKLAQEALTKGFLTAPPARSAPALRKGSGRRPRRLVDVERS